MTCKQFSSQLVPGVLKGGCVLKGMSKALVLACLATSGSQGFRDWGEKLWVTSNPTPTAVISMKWGF